jgi:SulP family sulfate permease
MDTSGLETLETLHARRKRGSTLILSGLREQPEGLAQRSGLLAAIGADNVVPTLAEAWHRARSLG